MSKVETTKIKKDLDNEKLTDACEQQLATDLELIRFFARKPGHCSQELLAVLRYRIGAATGWRFAPTGTITETASELDQ